MGPASARGRSPSWDTHTSVKRKISIPFLYANLETIKREGEVTKSMKLPFEEKNEPKK